MARFNKQIIGAFLISVSLSACSSVLDDFEFAQEEDSYTKQVTATATATQRGDVDKDANLQLELTCSYTAGEKPDPVQNTIMTFLVVDKKGEPYSLQELSYKFDESSVVEPDVTRSINSSEYNNEIKSLFLDFALGNLNTNLLVRYSFMQNIAVDDQNLENEIKNSYSASSNLKKISVRYETLNGMKNTAEFSVSGGNFAKVLKICGWDTMSARYGERLQNAAKKKKEEKEAAAAAAAEAAAAEAAAAEAAVAEEAAVDAAAAAEEAAY